MEKPKETVMAAALTFTGVMDFFERLNEGQGPMTAARDAYEATKERGEAIREASRKVRGKKRR